MKRILVTTDFSACSTVAFAKAIELQRLFGAKLIIATVVGSGDGEIARALHSIESIRRTYFENIPTETDLIRTKGNISHDLVHYAISHSVDLIIIASHGRTGIERLVIGSVAEKILRDAACPVLVVPYHRRKRTSEHEGEHIIVTTDFSLGSEAALPLALEFLQAFGSVNARLTILHVAENMLAATFDHPLGGSHEAIRCELELDAEKKLQLLQSTYFSDSLAMAVVVRGTHAVHQEIITYADAHDVDTLIVARHGHSTLEHALLGSVTEKLVRLARRPVIVVPRCKK